MLQTVKSKQTPNWYNRHKKISPKYRAYNAKYLSLFTDIFFPIQPNNLKYHMRINFCPKISLIQRWANPQLQFEKHFLVSMRKFEWFSLSFFLSQWFVTIFPSQMSSSHCISLTNLTTFHLNKWDIRTFSFEPLLHIGMKLKKPNICIIVLVWPEEYEKIKYTKMNILF